MSPLETKLRRMAGLIDEAALEALANKGLLRRARKDLERGIEVGVVGEDESSFRVRVAEFEVSLPETGPATAKCGCPAAGVCQHILMAVLFLQRPSLGGNSAQGLAQGGSAAMEDPDREWMAISPKELEAWAGKASFNAGLKVAIRSTAEILFDRGTRVRFPAMNAEVHFIPGGGLDGMIASGGAGDTAKLVVAAVVAFQRARGKEWATPVDTALEASDGAPRNRAETLRSCQDLLEETIANGLARLSTSNQQRWATLAVSALGVNLPRLALLLRGIGDEVSLAVSRDARSDTARLLDRMAQTHALCSALQNSGENPRADLAGFHRTRYDEIGNIDLVGAAAWPWRTGSGYTGLTVLFWDSMAKRWNSWTDSRPSHQTAGFKPADRYHQPGPWAGAESPRQLAQSSFRLMNARRNPANRLSGSGTSRALVTGPAHLARQGLIPIEDWTELLRVSNAGNAAGLKEASPLDSIHALKPFAWGRRVYDPVGQTFAWYVGDTRQHSLLLRLGFDDLTEPAIRYMEKAPLESLEGAMVIGRSQRAQGGLSVHPHSLHLQSGAVINLCLDTLGDNPAPAPAAEIGTEEGFEEEEDKASESTAAVSPAISRIIDELDDNLLALAESGLAAPNPLRLERIRRIVRATERLGLRALAVGLQNLVIRPESSMALRCAYLVRLHRGAHVHSG